MDIPSKPSAIEGANPAEEQSPVEPQAFAVQDGSPTPSFSLAQETSPLPVAAAFDLVNAPPAVPDYELLRRIGSGSYGDVWLARNVLGQFRAVKIIYRNRFVDPRPFEREFEGIQRFEPISRSHPSQLHILHVGKNDAANCFYYVMELADSAASEVNTESVNSNQCSTSSNGSDRPELKPTPLNTDRQIADYSPRTLRSDLDCHGRLPPANCVQIGLSLATALAHLHDQGLVHRDIKPSNIIFVNGAAKLGDIGLVTEAGDTQSIVGTEGYLPPEGPGTPRADIYSLGKVLYEISTGMDRRRFAELPDELREWPDRVAVVEFNEVVLKACAKDPAQRYASGEQLRADLESLQLGKSVKTARLIQWRWAMARKLAVASVTLATAVGVMVALLNRDQPTDTAEGGPPSTNELANALCSKALMNLRADNQRGFPEVYTNLHRAIGLDTNFAKPYVGLLELMIRENMPGIIFPPGESVRTVTKRLVELAPNSAAAHCGLSIVAYYDWDFPSAERHARRTIEIGPDYELGHTLYGFVLQNWGRTVESRHQLEISRRLNPSKVQIFRALAHVHYVERDFPRAIEMYREGIRWEPHDLPCYICMAWAYRAITNYQKAIDVFEEMETIESGEKLQSGGRFDQLRELRHALARDGVRGYWEKEWELAPTNQYYLRATIQARLGNTPAAFDLLEQSYLHQRAGERITERMTYLLFDDVWDPLRHHPQFQALLEKVGFTKVNPKLKQPGL